VDALEGIAAADAHLGRPVPLPGAALPLARWFEVEVEAAGAGAVEVAWNLDDSRPDTPGRLALAVARAPVRTQLPDAASEEVLIGERPAEHRTAPLEHAQPSLRPVHELGWEADGLHLRLTGQGPWTVEELVRIAASVG
jgi:hypothetical protein